MRVVVGVDEVHRGSLVGPVFAGACVLRFDDRFDGVTDSKKLTEAKRVELKKMLDDRGVTTRVASASATEIDELNIKRATQVAMMRALRWAIESADWLSRDDDVGIVVDGNEQFDFDLHGQNPLLTYGIEVIELTECVRRTFSSWPSFRFLPKADATVHAVSCASIAAKVEADAWLSAQPDAAKYGWAENSGYATKKHVEAIREHGKPSIYRHSFKLPSYKPE